MSPLSHAIGHIKADKGVYIYIYIYLLSFGMGMGITITITLLKVEESGKLFVAH